MSARRGSDRIKLSNGSARLKEGVGPGWRVRPEQPVVGDSARRVNPYRPFLGRTRLAQGEADEENDQGQERLNPSHGPILPDAVRVQQRDSQVSKPRVHDAGVVAG